MSSRRSWELAVRFKLQGLVAGLGMTRYPVRTSRRAGRFRTILELKGVEMPPGYHVSVFSNDSGWTKILCR